MKILREKAKLKRLSKGLHLFIIIEQFNQVRQSSQIFKNKKKLIHIGASNDNSINIFKQYDIHDEIPQPKRLPTPIEKPEHPIEKPKHSIKKEENKSVQVNKKTPENIPKAVEKNSKNLKYHGIPERNPRSLIESVHNTKRSQIETHKDVQKEVKHIPHTSVNHNNIHAVQNDVKNNKQQDHIDSSKAIKPVEEFQIPKEKHVEVIAKTAKEEKHEKPSILDSVEQNVAMQASSKGSKQRYSSIPSSNKSKTKSREFEIPKRNSSRVKENNDGQKVESALPKKTVAMKSSQEPKENKVPKHAINIEIPNPKFKEEEKTSKVPPASKKASKKPTTSKSKKKPAKHSMNRDSQDGRIQCSYCQRLFSSDRIDVHENACQNVQNSKRKVFNRIKRVFMMKHYEQFFK